MSKKTEMKIEDIKTLGDIAKFRIDVLQPMPSSPEKQSLRKAFKEKAASIRKESKTE